MTLPLGLMLSAAKFEDMLEGLLLLAIWQQGSWPSEAWREGSLHLAAERLELSQWVAVQLG